MCQSLVKAPGQSCALSRQKPHSCGACISVCVGGTQTVNTEKWEKYLAEEG